MFGKSQLICVLTRPAYYQLKPSFIGQAFTGSHDIPGSSKTARRNNKGDWEGVENVLKKAEESFFNNCPDTNTVEANWQFFKKTILDTIDMFIPKKHVSGTYQSPWMTKYTCHLIGKTQRTIISALSSHEKIHPTCPLNGPLRTRRCPAFSI